MLLGISLVVQELHKGPRLLYRYPAQNSNYYQQLTEDIFEDRITPDIQSKLKRITAENKLKSIFRQYFNLSDENFAKLFRKPPIGKLFELGIGDLELVSFPCQSPKVNSLDDDQDLQQSGLHQVSMFNFVLAIVPNHVLRTITGDNIIKCCHHRSSFVGFNPLASASSCLTDFGGLCKLTLKKVLETASNSLMLEEKSSRYLTIQVNNIIKILESQIHSNRVNAQNSVVPIMRIDIGGKIPDPYLNAEGDDQEHDARSATEAEVPLANLQLQSRLCNEIRLLFHSLLGGNSVDIRFNEGKSTNVLLYCRDYHHCPEYESQNAVLLSKSHDDESLPRKTNTNKFRGIDLTMQTALVVADFDAVMNQLLYHGGIAFSSYTEASNHNSLNSHRISSNNSRLSNFVELADPTKSFLDLSLMLDEPVEELISMTTYLQSLGLVEVIPVVYKQSVYVIHSGAKVGFNSKVSRAYELFIKGLDIKVKPLIKTTSFQTRKRSTSHSSSSNVVVNNGTKKADGIDRNFRVAYGHVTDDIRSKWASGKFETTKSSYKQSSQARISPVNPALPNGSLSSLTQNDIEKLERVLNPGIRYHDENEIDFDRSSDLPQDFSLPYIISLFDGIRPLSEVLNLFPNPLKEFGIDILVFLLRWHILSSVTSFLVNTTSLCDSSSKPVKTLGSDEILPLIGNEVVGKKTFQELLMLSEISPEHLQACIKANPHLNLLTQI